MERSDVSSIPKNDVKDSAELSKKPEPLPRKIRHEGSRWQIVFGSFEGISASAVTEMQKYMQDFLPYVIETVSSEEMDIERHLCLLGCMEDNPLLKELVARGLLPLPEKAQGFSIASAVSPWNSGRKIIAVAGFDESALLHGVNYLNAHLLAKHVGPLRGEDCRAALEKLPPLKVEESPAIENRGIWTWGYPIYEFRKFIDNMAKLRMNMITVWHDEPPLNSAEFIAYAHSRGIRVIYGFACGWGSESLDLSKQEDRNKIKSDVLARYRHDYLKLEIDGIYFQTLTENDRQRINGHSTASLACELVNDIAAGLFEISPSLYLQFGLHASSIGENYRELQALNQKVQIVWEDAGGIPYTYSIEEGPDGSSASASKVAGVETLEETVSYSMKLAGFRGGNAEFGLVPKGLCSIDWVNEFENHGRYIMGERSVVSQERQFDKRRSHWNRVNQSWFRFYPEIAKFYREIRAAHKGTITVTGLIEDGLFEYEIQPSVSLFAEMLWNPERKNEDLLLLAMSPFYRN